MSKIFVLLALGAGVLLLGAGCGAAKNLNVNNSNGSAKNNQFQNQSGNGQAGDIGFRGMNFSTGTVSSLAVGVKATVMGASNSDGSISATRIIIGDFPVLNFRTSTGEMTSGTFGNSNGQGYGQNTNTDNTNGQAMPTGQTNGQRTRFAGRASGMAGQSNPRGEIISVGNDNIVLKLDAGGSKIIYFSDSTEISLVLPPVVTSSTPPISSSVK